MPSKTRDGQSGRKEGRLVPWGGPCAEASSRVGVCGRGRAERGALTWTVPGGSVL